MKRQHSYIAHLLFPLSRPFIQTLRAAKHQLIGLCLSVYEVKTKNARHNNTPPFGCNATRGKPNFRYVSPRLSVSSTTAIERR